MATLKAFLDSLQELVVIAGMAVTVYLTWRNGTRIQDVHAQINGRMDQLLEVTRTSSKAAGVKQGEAGRGPGNYPGEYVPMGGK